MPKAVRRAKIAVALSLHADAHELPVTAQNEARVIDGLRFEWVRTPTGLRGRWVRGRADDAR
jgi:hypothetical protein